MTRVGVAELLIFVDEVRRKEGEVGNRVGWVWEVCVLFKVPKAKQFVPLAVATEGLGQARLERARVKDWSGI